MRNFVIWLTVGLLLFVAGCGDQRQSQIVGAWNADGDRYTFNTDGSFCCEITIGGGVISTSSSAFISGTWRVSGDDLVMACTHSSYNPDEAVGLVESEKITQMSDDYFTTIDSYDEINSYSRVR